MTQGRALFLFANKVHVGSPPGLECIMTCVSGKVIKKTTSYDMMQLTVKLKRRFVEFIGELLDRVTAIGFNELG